MLRPRLVLFARAFLYRNKRILFQRNRFNRHKNGHKTMSRIIRKYNLERILTTQQLVFKSLWCPIAESPVVQLVPRLFFVVLKVRLSAGITLPFKIVVPIIQASTSFVFFHFSGTNSKTSRPSKQFSALSYAAASGYQTAPLLRSMFSLEPQDFFFLPRYSFLSRTPIGTL